MENKQWLKELKVGDKVTRMFVGSPMNMKVTKIINSIITCEPDEDPEISIEKTKSGAIKTAILLGKDVDEYMKTADISIPYWEFSANTGGEIDVQLGYDGINTCSYLIQSIEN